MAGTSRERPLLISQMNHWRLRWCQSSDHPWHPLLVNFEVENANSNMSECDGKCKSEISTNCRIKHVVFPRRWPRKIRHRVTRCLHTHAPRRGQIIYIAASALSGRLNVDWLGMIGRAVSETGAIEPAAADVPRGDLDLGRMLLNVCISVVLESATMRPTEDCFSSGAGFNSILHN